MNSDWKKVLILWVIAIAISAITLYSFRDVQFKNTKKLAEQNAKLQAEIQSQIDAYEPTQIQTTDTTLATTWEFTLVLPWFFANGGFDDIVMNLTNSDIHVTYKYIMTPDELKYIVKNSFSDNDMYLIPMDWIDSLNLEWIYVWENIKPYFSTIFHDVLSDSENKFIPYSIDPLVTITKPWVQNINSRSSLMSYITLWVQNKAFAMPLIWWIWESDINLLSEWNWPFENYFEILYQHLKLIKQKHDVNELNNMLAMETVDLSFKYTLEKMEQLVTLLKKNNANCDSFPWICLFAYNFWDIKFWFLSDLDIWDRYFSERNMNLSIQAFINTDTTYPVRVWWFVVPKDNMKKNLSTKFIESYIIQATQWDTKIWGNTLPAINTSFEEKKNWEIYKNIIWFSENFDIWRDSIDAQEKFISDSKNLDLLRWVYSTDVYINQ